MTVGGSGGRVFIVHGAASAHLPLRLLNFFAQQDLLPDMVCMTRVNDCIAMRIDEGTLDSHRAAIILAKMSALSDVASATLDGVGLEPVGSDQFYSSQQGKRS